MQEMFGGDEMEMNYGKWIGFVVFAVGAFVVFNSTGYLELVGLMFTVIGGFMQGYFHANVQSEV